jgi:hypothetical protein
VRFLAVIPVFAHELAYAERHGGAALLSSVRALQPDDQVGDRSLAVPPVYASEVAADLGAPLLHLARRPPA